MKTIINIIKHALITKLISEATEQGSDYITSRKDVDVVFDNSPEINNKGIKLLPTCTTLEEKGIHRENTQRTTLPNYTI
jgi:hypothetical protein